MMDTLRRPRNVARWAPITMLIVACLSGCERGESQVGSATPRVENWLTERHATPIACETRLDSTGGGPLALGLFVRCEVRADSAGVLMGRATLWQRGGDVLVATANAHGSDRTNSSQQSASPESVEVKVPAPGAFEFWFPGSEIQHEGHPGEATILIEVWPSHTPQGPVRYYRYEIPNLETARFVERLPGSVGPWPR